MEDFKNNFKEAISTGDTKEIMHLIQSLRDIRDGMTQGDKTCVLGQGLYDVIISPNRTVNLVRQLIEAGADVNHTDGFKQSVLLQALDGKKATQKSQLKSSIFLSRMELISITKISTDKRTSIISSRKACSRILFWLN